MWQKQELLQQGLRRNRKYDFFGKEGWRHGGRPVGRVAHKRQWRYWQKGRRSTEDIVGLLHQGCWTQNTEKRKKSGVTSSDTAILSFAVLPIALCFFIYPTASRWKETAYAGEKKNLCLKTNFRSTIYYTKNV